MDLKIPLENYFNISFKKSLNYEETFNVIPIYTQVWPYRIVGHGIYQNQYSGNCLLFNKLRDTEFRVKLEKTLLIGINRHYRSIKSIHIFHKEWYFQILHSIEVFKDMEVELYTNIVSNLNLHEIENLALVNKQFKKINEAPEFWSLLILSNSRYGIGIGNLIEYDVKKKYYQTVLFNYIYDQYSLKQKSSPEEIKLFIETQKLIITSLSMKDLIFYNRLIIQLSNKKIKYRGTAGGKRTYFSFTRDRDGELCIEMEFKAN